MWLCSASLNFVVKYVSMCVVSEDVSVHLNTVCLYVSARVS